MRDLPENLRQVDWTLTSWEGSRREQMRRWAALPLDRIVASLEEMEELTRMFRGLSAEGDDSTPSRRNPMDIRHEPESRRFAVTTEHGEATLTYSTVGDDTLDFRSTFVPEEDREGGVGEKLVLHALEWARDHDKGVIPSCTFVSRVVRDHPEHQTTIASGGKVGGG